MSNLKKTYTIEIQMDNARQQLADAVQKLNELDNQLTGLDRGSAAGKQLIAEMAAAAKAVEDLTAEVQDLGDELDTFKPGSIGALEKEVEELERAWKRTTVGTKESQEALLALGNAKGQLKELGDQIDALDPSEKAAALVDFTNGLVGGFSIAATAAQQWGGLSAESAEEVEQRLQSLLVVMSSFEAISKAVSGETLTNVKNMYGLAKSYLFAGEAASTGAKVTRGALAATGIGLIIILVGTLIANWDALTSKVSGSEKFFVKVRAVASGLFDSAIASVKNFGGVINKLFHGDFSGALAKAKSVGQEMGKAFESGYQEVIDDENRKLLAKYIETQERLLKVQQAGGRDTDKLQREILANKLAVLKNGTEAEQKAHAEAASDLAAFDAAQAKKQREEKLAATLARINATVALEQAAGKSAYQKQLQEKQAELAGLLAAETKNQAAIIAKRGEIAAFVEQHEQEQTAKRRALLVEKQQNEVALLEKQGKDTLALRTANAQALLTLDTGTTEQALAQKRVDKQALLLLEEEYNQREKTQREAFREQAQEYEANAGEVDRTFAKAAGEAASEAYVEGLGKAAKQASLGADLGRTILTNFFGVKPEDVETVKGKLNDAFAEIAQSVGGAVSSMLSSGLTEAQTQIDAAQARLQELDTQLSAASSARENTQAQLETATGARRNYLLSQLEKQRAAEQKLANEKAKAAKEEQQAQQEKAKLEKQQQQISAASTAIEAVLLGIKAAQTLVDIASKGKFGVDNIALAIAAAAALGGGIFAMKSAASKFESGTGALGSDGVLRGPSHGQGGIGLFNSYGHFYGEAEGGEAITPVDATNNNSAVLELIRTKGRSRRLTPLDYISALAGGAQDVARSVVPTPKAYYEAGGLLNKGGTPGGQASSADLGALAARLDQQSALLAQLVASNANAAESAAATASATTATAGHTGTLRDYGPPRIVRSYQEILGDEQLLRDAKQAENTARL